MCLFHVVSLEISCVFLIVLDLALFYTIFLWKDLFPKVSSLIASQNYLVFFCGKQNEGEIFSFARTYPLKKIISDGRVKLWKVRNDHEFLFFVLLYFVFAARVCSSWCRYCFMYYFLWEILHLFLRSFGFVSSRECGALAMNQSSGPVGHVLPWWLTVAIFLAYLFLCSLLRCII